ncbi:restriction endonuclease-like protein [Paenibacillus kobensis]|uniref:restriction endonuclease-like protein n=1 Tax=Paenibacillus kobensis TaxID=59841 RepID=UPI0027D82121|nr:restriction endonuclease-like protein [Paenibacillus kobensis]
MTTEIAAVAMSPHIRIEEFRLYSVGRQQWVDGFSEQVEPCLYETQSYELIIESHTDQRLEFYHTNPHIRRALKPVGRSGRVFSGLLQFQNEIGYTDLEIRLGGETALMLRLEIYPTKLDYKRDYHAILHEVNQQVYNLSFDFLRRTYQTTGLTHTTSQSLTEYFAILQSVFHQLVSAVERIERMPHHQMDEERHVRDANKVKRAGRENISFLAKRQHLLTSDQKHGFIPIHGQMYRPTQLLETKRKLSYDTNENRFLRWMLERIDRKLGDIHAIVRGKDWRSQDPELLEQITRMKTALRRLLQFDFLQQSGQMQHFNVSMVLQMAPGYREAYRIYLTLMKGLSIQSDLFHISMKDLAQLYEYWCFLKIHELLARKYRLLKQDIIRVNRSGLFVTLDKTQRAKVDYENPHNGEKFSLYYNALPSEDQRKDPPTLAQRPDNVLTLHKHDGSGQAKVYKYVFDAKYRINPAYEGSSYRDQYSHPGPEEDDINTMHRYRDSIVFQEKGSTEYERSMFGAYVLFPYSDEEKFKEHRFYRSIDLINIGAFPLLPGSTSLLEAFLDELILDSPEKAFERSTQPRGTKPYYENKLSGRNMLVGSMRTGQLEAVLQNSSYYMPLRNLSDHKVLTQLEYIALCQSRKQFQHEAGVQWYGRVLDWKIVKRSEITERPARPNTEDDLYVYFKIEQWQKRKISIALGGQGVYTCLYTTKYLFDRAIELAELRLDDESQLREWREKRRRGKVKVRLDREYVDLAERVLGIEVAEQE